MTATPDGNAIDAAPRPLVFAAKMDCCGSNELYSIREAVALKVTLVDQNTRWPSFFKNSGGVVIRMPSDDLDSAPLGKTANSFWNFSEFGMQCLP